MTDGNGMTISNVSVSRNLCVSGDTLTASLTVKNGSGVNIPDFRISLYCSKADFSKNESDRKTTFVVFHIATDSLAKGKTASFSATRTILEKAAQYFADYPDVRSVPVYIGYTANDTDLGNFRHVEYLLEDLTLINAYYQPRIADFDLQRCIGGVPNDEGENVLSTLQLALDDAAGVPFMHAHLHYAENADATEDSTYLDLTEVIPDLLAGTSDSADLIPESFSNGSNWDFLLVFGDAYEKSVATQSLSRAFANFHLSGEKTGGACFGGFSSSSFGVPKLESHFEGFFYGGIHGVSNYCEDEVLTGGRWIDNKPIYRRVVALGDVAASSTVSASVGSGAIGSLVSLRAFGKRGTSIRVLPYASATASANAALSLANWESDDPKISVSTGSSGGINGVIAVIEYTKAADAAIEPASPYAVFTDSEGKALADANNSSFMTEVY